MADSASVYTNVPAHYNLKIQPYIYITANNLGWEAGNVVKYVSRAGRKGGPDDEIKDWEKVIHYAELKLEGLRLKRADNRPNDMDSFEPAIPKVQSLDNTPKSLKVVGSVVYSEYSNNFYMYTGNGPLDGFSSCKWDPDNRLWFLKS